MEIKPVEEGASLVEEAVSVVQAVVDKPKKATPKKKAQVKRKKAATEKLASKQAAKPLAKETPLTAAEIRETLTDAKTQLVEIGLEPVTTALASWSSTIRGAVGGFMDGLLNTRNKK